MTRQPFPLVVVEGDPFERGYQHGTQARDRVAVTLETHRRAIQHFSGLDWLAVVERASAYLPSLQAYSPEMVEELRGIAEGAGLPFPDVMATNVRYELTFTPRMAGGCTAFAVLPEATANGHTYLGQSWDYLAAIGNACIILKAERKGCPDYVTFAEAGVPAMIGVNSRCCCIAQVVAMARPPDD